MKITRKGYYTILGPDDILLLDESGATRQATTRDDCYEYITEDGRGGTFVIVSPDYEVEIIAVAPPEPIPEPIPEPDPEPIPEPPVGTGITYYISDTGDDLNDGLSHASAWKTYAKSNSVFSSLNGGDSILFCKGEQFVISGSSVWKNFNSSSNNRITISSYTPPNATAGIANPTIYAAGGGSAFQMMNGGNAEHNEGYIISNLVLRGENNGGNGILIYNDSDYIDINNVEIYDFRIGIHYSGSNPANPGSDGRNSDLQVKSVFVHDNKSQGFLGGGDNLLIADSVFVNNGFELAVFNHNIYISSPAGRASNEIIRNNRLYQSAMVNGEAAGASLVVHGDHTNLLIENNVVWEDVGAVGQGCWGIAVDNGYSSFEQFPGLIIRGNTVVNVGNMAIGCSCCPGAIIEDNTIVHQSLFGADVIRIPDRDENSSPSNPQSNNVTVRNNTVLYDSSADGTGIKLGDGDGATYTSKDNNIYYAVGSSMVPEVYNAGDTVTASGNTISEGIPQNLLDAALAKTKIT